MSSKDVVSLILLRGGDLILFARSLIFYFHLDAWWMDIFSEWPTIPQLYVNGEFIGGCDIVTQMHENGELKELLAEVKED